MPTAIYARTADDAEIHIMPEVPAPLWVSIGAMDLVSTTQDHSVPLTPDPEALAAVLADHGWRVCSLWSQSRGEVWRARVERTALKGRLRHAQARAHLSQLAGAALIQVTDSATPRTASALSTVAVLMEALPSGAPLRLGELVLCELQATGHVEPEPAVRTASGQPAAPHRLRLTHHRGVPDRTALALLRADLLTSRDHAVAAAQLLHPHPVTWHACPSPDEPAIADQVAAANWYHNHRDLLAHSIELATRHCPDTVAVDLAFAVTHLAEAIGDHHMHRRAASLGAQAAAHEHSVRLTSLAIGRARLETSARQRAMARLAISQAEAKLQDLNLFPLTEAEHLLQARLWCARAEFHRAGTATEAGEAVTAAAEAVEAARLSGDTAMLASAWETRAEALDHLGLPAEAFAAMEEALELWRERGEHHRMAVAQVRLARLLRLHGGHRRAA